jgi:hypothetical protein
MNNLSNNNETNYATNYETNYATNYETNYMTKYVTNKKMYQSLMGMVNQNHMNGGAKNTTYDLTMQQYPKYFNLPKAKDIRLIGTFIVKDRVVCGDVDYTELNLKKGKYKAYKIDDNLMIIHDDVKDKVNRNIVKWKWIHSGTGVGVDSGRFGFFDRNAIQQIMIGDKNNNSLPYINYKYRPNDYSIITKDNIDPIYEKKGIELPDWPFGCMSGTGTGDGGFECYVVGKDRAILLGGLTSGIMYGDEN